MSKPLRCEKKLCVSTVGWIVAYYSTHDFILFMIYYVPVCMAGYLSWIMRTGSSSYSCIYSFHAFLRFKLA
jgi:hypothetical protein